MLWLLRHAEAADGQPDEERPLTDRGVQQAEAAGRALGRLGERIDVCLSSPKRRALQTAELACDPLSIPVTPDPRLGGEPIDISAVTEGRHNVLLVGHDPSFSLLVHDLTGTQARMKKGGLAAISKGELVAFLRPADLAAIAEAAVVSTR
jgi:phosphohistidine phosphatase